MATKNEVTGDLIQSRGPTDAYREGWERIFGNRDSRTAKTDSKQPEAFIERPLRPINWLPSDIL